MKIYTPGKTLFKATEKKKDYNYILNNNLGWIIDMTGSMVQIYGYGVMTPFGEIYVEKNDVDVIFISLSIDNGGIIKQQLIDLFDKLKINYTDRLGTLIFPLYLLEIINQNQENVTV